VGNSRTHDWTRKRIALLTEMWMAGYSSGECARRLCVSRNAAIGKLRRLGLLGRDRPQLPTMRLGPPPARVLLKTTEQVSKPPQKPRKVPNKRNTRPLPPPEPYQAPPPPPVPPIGSFNLLDLRHNSCRWPQGDGPIFVFCGRPQASQSSYCEEHTKRSLSGLARGVPYVAQRMARS